MTEYIEREEINEAMKEVCDDPSCPMYVAAEIAQIIDCAPAADVVPVVHGEWTPYGIGKGMTFCSNCEYNGKREYRYCPNCGAKMDGGAE